MSTPTATTDYAARSARAYEQQLRQQLKRHGTPDLDPEDAGRRAAIFTSAGRAWADEIGPFYDTPGAQAALGGVTKQAVSQRVSERRLLGLRLAVDGTSRARMVYPVWQFDSGVLRHLPAVLAVAGFTPDRPTTGWTIATWLMTSDARIGGMTAVRMLRAGHVSQVLELAGDIAVSLGVQERAAVQDGALTGSG